MADSDEFTPTPPSQFGLVRFAENNPAYFKEYITYRLHGYNAHVAFRRVFGQEELATNGHLKVEEIEHNPWVRKKLAQLVKATAVSTLWDDKVAVHELLNMARNPFFKEQVRLGAIKELNVLTGVTVIDEKGVTRKGMSLKDYYGSNGGEPGDRPAPLEEPGPGLPH